MKGRTYCIIWIWSDAFIFMMRHCEMDILRQSTQTYLPIIRRRQDCSCEMSSDADLPLLIPPFSNEHYLKIPLTVSQFLHKYASVCQTFLQFKLLNTNVRVKKTCQTCNVPCASLTLGFLSLLVPWMSGEEHP